MDLDKANLKTLAVLRDIVYSPSPQMYSLCDCINALNYSTSGSSFTIFGVTLNPAHLLKPLCGALLY